jgi:hypothetical protein
MLSCRDKPCRFILQGTSRKTEQTMSMTSSAQSDVVTSIKANGFVYLDAAKTRALLDTRGGIADWDQFASSWNDLSVDTYMADGGKYRRRRHAVFSVDNTGAVTREKHQPHYQGLEYNALNGGIERWFEPVLPAIADSIALRSTLALCSSTASSLRPDVATWRVEMHQFRIDAVAGSEGKPTPEGMHRDGVDFVLVLMVRRNNITSGTTTLADNAKLPIGSFTLTAPLDAVMVDDQRLYHGVTPVAPLDQTQPAFRDVLVLTFKANR